VAPAVLIVLDACRDDPFGEGAGKGRSAKPLAGDVKAAVKPGLGRIGEAENTLFVFSAAPGKTASDGDGGNSPFSAALAKYLPTAGLEIQSVLTLVQQDVYDATRGRQSPWIESAPFPRMFFAADSGALPERDRLLLAMADLTPDLRDQVERVATKTDVPLAPLYGALIAADLKSLTPDQRERKLDESAQAYVETQGKLKALSSTDPNVAQLREAAESSLALGAFAEARAKLASAAAIDARSGDMLAANLVERRLSEAATHVADAGVARTQLDYPAAIAALEKAAALHEKVEAEDVPDAARHDRDWLLADLGQLNERVGDTAAALRAYERMRAAAELRSAKTLGDPDAQRDVAQSWEAIGNVEAIRGDLGGALDSYARGLTIRKKLAGWEPNNFVRRHDVASNLERIGDVKVTQGDLPGALQAYSEGLEIIAALAAQDESDPVRQRDLSVGWMKMGEVKAASRDLDGALADYSKSLAIARKLIALDEGDASRQADLAAVLQRVGDIRKKKDDLAGALDAYTEGVGIVGKLVERDGHNTEWQRNLGLLWIRVGEVRKAQGDLSGALEAYLDSLPIAQRLAALDPANVDWQRDLSVNDERIGEIRKEQGDISGALERYEASLARMVPIRDRDLSNADLLHFTSSTLVVIGDLKFGQHDMAGALQAYSDSLAARKRLAALDAGNSEWQRDLSVSWENVGDAKAARGDIAGALQAYSETLAIAEELVGRDGNNATWQFDLIISHYKLAQIGEDPRGHYTKALELARTMRKNGTLPPGAEMLPGFFVHKLADLK
jgi:uncharacterized caspase-like protein